VSGCRRLCDIPNRFELVISVVLCALYKNVAVGDPYKAACRPVNPSIREVLHVKHEANADDESFDEYIWNTFGETHREMGGIQY